MVEDVYPAEVALLHYSFYAGERGIVLKLNGLNDKLPLLLETILSHFPVFESNLSDAMFKAVRDQVRFSI
jgi:nardilysin